MPHTHNPTSEDIEQRTPDDVAPQATVRLAQLDTARQRIQTLLDEQHLTEAVVRRVADQASLHSRRSRVLLDALPWCIVLFDLPMTYQFLNRAAADYLGVSDSDGFMGQPVHAIPREALVASGLTDRLHSTIDLHKPQTWQYIDPTPRPRTWHACLTPLHCQPTGIDGVMLTLEQIALEACDSQPKENAATVTLASLSPREREILDFVAAGYSSRQIATILYRSPKTVQLHRYHIATKLGTSNVALWVRMLLDAGVLRHCDEPQLSCS